MPQKTYLDENGNPIPASTGKVYLDDSGNPIKPAKSLSSDMQASKDNGSIEALPSLPVRAYREGKARLLDLVKGASDLTAGIGSGAINTGLGLSKAANFATGGRLGVKPETTLAGLGGVPANPTQELGMGLEQAGEFFLPEGAIGKVGRGVEVATAGIKGNRILNAIRGGLNLAARSGMEAASAAGVSSLQGENPTGPALAAAAGPVVGEVVGHYAPKIYRAALKPSTTYAPDKVADLVNTGLTERIPVSNAGRRKLVDLVEELNGRVRGMLDPNIKVSPTAIASRADQAVPKYDKFAQVNPESDIKSIAEAKAEFLRQHQTPYIPPTLPQPTGVLDQFGNPVMTAGSPAVHPQDIPISAPQVQDIKTGTYRNVGWKKGTPSQLPPASEAGQKALARGAKEELEIAFPSIKEINAREGRALSLKEAMERAVNRIENRDVVGIGAPIAATAATAMGGPGSAVGLLKLLPPGATSRLAIQMALAKQRMLGPLAGGLAAQIQRRHQ